MKSIKRVIISVLALIYALLAVATTTYAWYVTIYTLQESDLDLSCYIDENLLISGDGINWYEDELPIEAIEFKNNNMKITDLTLHSIRDRYGYRHAFFDIDGYGRIVENEITSGYVEFYLYFYSKTPNLAIYYSEDTSITSNPVLFNFEGKSYSLYASNALRIETGDVIFEPKNEFDQGGYETNKNDNLALRYFDYVRSNDLDYQNIWGEGGIKTTEDPPATFSETGIVKGNHIGYASDTSQYGIRFRIWIEGFDSDCVDAILATSARKITLNLSFVGVPEHMV